jgi:hypothetical protein
VDVRELFAALRFTGYDGWPSVENVTTEQPHAERVRRNAAFLWEARIP